MENGSPRNMRCTPCHPGPSGTRAVSGSSRRGGSSSTGRKILCDQRDRGTTRKGRDLFGTTRGNMAKARGRTTRSTEEGRMEGTHVSPLSRLSWGAPQFLALKCSPEASGWACLLEGRVKQTLCGHSSGVFLPMAHHSQRVGLAISRGLWLRRTFADVRTSGDSPNLHHRELLPISPLLARVFQWPRRGKSSIRTRELNGLWHCAVSLVVRHVRAGRADLRVCKPSTAGQSPGVHSPAILGCTKLVLFLVTCTISRAKLSSDLLRKKLTFYGTRNAAGSAGAGY